MNDSNPAYLFGDTDLAAERLRRLAAAFDPSSREFLESLRMREPRQVADLGCGPGYTTRLLADVFTSAMVCGLDSSENFIAVATQAASECTSFAVADVTRSLPGGPYDLIYARYLLTHVPNYRAALTLWSRHLADAGAIAIEENEWIRADEPAFEKYLSIVAAMLADGGQKLYVGAELESDEPPPGLTRLTSQLVPIPVSDCATARMFLPNLATWRTKPFVASHYTSAELDRLRADLERLSEEPSPRSSITFGRRRIVFCLDR